MNRKKAKKLDQVSRSTLVRLVRKLHPHLNRQGIKQHLKSAKNQRIAALLENYNPIEESSMVERGRIIDEIFRVICFASSEAESRDEILMWSHYSASHKGVRIGFEFPINKTFSLSPIDYSVKRVAVDMSVMGFDPISQEKAIAQSIRTKSKAWEYEKEHRLFVDPTACIKITDINGKTVEFLNIENDWVKRVDFGTRYPLQERDSFLDLLKKQYPLAACYQAQYHKTDYALDYDRLM
jgi:Protein of unknown function (DUF2971)